MKKNKYLGIILSLLLGVLLTALVVGCKRQDEGIAVSPQAAVTNYKLLEVADGATSYITTGGNLTGFDVLGYGSAVVHVSADASATTSTLTVYPMYSNELVNCTTASNWFTGTDYVVYSVGAEGALSQVVIDPAQIASTVNTTGSHSFTGGVTETLVYVITSTYNYGTSTYQTHTVQAAISAGAGYNSVVQSLALTGDLVSGREFTVYGKCMRLRLTVSYGTITPTIYVMARDVKE